VSTWFDPVRAATPVRAVATFTPDLHALVDWLLQCGIDTVARASTGVYGVSIFIRVRLLQLTGVNLVTVTGISASIAQTIPSEVGTA
jgi:hypothetical protein